jgi:glycine cleavage system aminomethyltransferase T
MKNTPLTSRHIALGAKMAEFAGYNMPIVYSSLKDEHFAVRNNVGIFDVSHMGEFIVKGKEALALIQQVTSNDASKLAIGQAQYSCLPNHEGGIVDDLLVYRLDEDQCAEGEQAFMLVVNASNIDKDWDWINGQNSFDTRMVNISDQTGLLAVQGPKAIEVLQTLTDVKLADIPYYHFTKGRIAGLDNVIISATGYTGAGGFELYCREEDTPLALGCRAGSRKILWTFSPQASVPGIHFVSRWVFAFTAMILMILPRRSKLAWDGSPNSKKASLIVLKYSHNRRPTVSPANWQDLSYRTGAFQGMNI